MAGKLSYEELEERVKELEKEADLLRQTKEALNESENKYRSLYTTMLEGVCLHELIYNKSGKLVDFEIIDVNPAYETILGVDKDYAVGRKASEIFLPCTSPYMPIYEKIATTGQPQFFETYFKSKDKYLSVSAFSPSDGQFATVFSDITKRKKAEDALQKSQRELDSIIRTTPDIIYRLDPNGKISFINESIKQYNYAPEELIQQDIMVFVHPDDKEKARYRINERRTGKRSTKGLELRFLVKGQETERVFLVDVEGLYQEGENKGTFLGTQGVARDITDRKQSEEERLKIEEKLHHAQKLESLGVLAGGIAHDFNNLLMGILGNADMALLDISPVSPVIRNLRNIKKASQRAADLAGQMLAYSGKGKFVIEPININEVITDMTHLLEASLSKKVRIKYDFTAPIPSIEADVTQIRQIVMNLIINAAEAIGEESGVIRLTTGVVACDRSYLDNTWLAEECSKGNYVYIDVTDTGRGIKESDIANIFDPFFTTKFTGRGLGLSAVQGIVRGHKGTIKITSEPSKGTTFKVLFPACDQAAKFMVRELSSEETFFGSGTVLLVDDEEVVRDIGTKMLERMGFSVLTANDGYMAVDLFKQKSKEIFCVLLDLTMPRMDGEEAFRELCTIREDVHVILSSGYSEQEIVNHFGDKKPSGFIQKPYEYKKLISEMSKVVE